MSVMKIDNEGWVNLACVIPSPNFDERSNTEVPLVVIHYISLPPETFSGDAIQNLFTNQLRSDDPSVDLARLADLRVSAHFLIRRRGKLLQFVSCNKRAWHAGASSFQGRSSCNDFSIGIELEGSSLVPFTAAQYRKLFRLLRVLRDAYDVRALAGHCDVAPGRKVDPGPMFDWASTLAECQLPRPQVA